MTRTRESLRTQGERFDDETRNIAPRSAVVTPRWRTVNITPVERLGRIAIGLATILVGAILLANAGSVLAVALEVLLILAGVDLLVTGALGHCPLYQRLGYVPASLRRLR